MSLGRFLSSLVLAGWGSAAAPAWAQQPLGPPPAAAPRQHIGPVYHELLPEVGKIGAQVGLVAGVAGNPFEVGPGAQLGGFVDLPLARIGPGKLSYEILLALSLGTSDAFQASSGGAPVRTRLRLLQASPFSLKYTFAGADPKRVRPYVLAGADAFVAYTRDEPEAADPVRAGRGLPTGSTSLALGAHGGGGVELRLSAGASVNFEYRFGLFEGRHTRLHAASSALGLHW